MFICVKMEFFLVQNRDGKFFRSKGRSGAGLTWVESGKDAKIYTKISQARAVVTYFARHYPDYGVPRIIQIGVEHGEVIREDSRVRKSIVGKELRDLKRKKIALERLVARSTEETEYIITREEKLRKEIADIESRLSIP